jgi:acyl-CoA reductase-like NAD-dependent aldehyde dehydrogenase/uncharacterized protein (DUF2141 family)
MNGVSPEERIHLSRRAQQAWNAQTRSQRRCVLSEFRRAIATSRDRIVQAIVQDTGKPPLDALAGDLLVTLEHARYCERHFASVLAPHAVKRSRVLYPGVRFREEWDPFGVALIFAPSNYPFQLSMVPALTALFSGNAVVLKMSERTPAVARIVEELAAANLPLNLLQVVTDLPDQAGDYIEAGPDFIFFTGSSANGRRIAQRAALKLIPVLLELGGKDAALIFADCNLERAIEGVVYGAFSNAGQVCVAIKRAYIEETLYEDFLKRLVRRVEALRIGTTSECDLGFLQGKSIRSQFQSQVEEALAHGARMEFTRDESLAGDGPIVLSHVPPASRLLVEETFGPILCVAPFTDEGEAIDLVNRSPFALGASVWTRDQAKGLRVASALQTGTCTVNDVIRNIGNPHAAFGGNRASGYGRYHGSHGLRAFSRVKTVMTTHTVRAREINWFPFTQKTYQGLDTLIALRHRVPGAFRLLRRLLFLLLLTATFATCTAAQPKASAQLRLEVQIPAKAHGTLAYLVFDSPQGFPEDASKAIRRGFIPCRGTETVHIDAGDLPPGHYAVSVYLDENQNGKLDINFIGIPKEPVGASNNPKPRLGPPRFKDCTFGMGNADRTLQIKLVEAR